MLHVLFFLGVFYGYPMQSKRRCIVMRSFPLFEELEAERDDYVSAQGFREIE